MIILSIHSGSVKDHYCQSQFLVFNYLHYCGVPNPQADQCPLVLCIAHIRVSVACFENEEQLMCRCTQRQAETEAKVTRY